MWTYIAGKILRYRHLLLILIGLVTIFMAYKAKDVSISYDFINLLPEKDSTFTQEKEFKKVFHKDVNIMVLGIQDSTLFELDKFNDWLTLADSIRKVNGIEGVASLGRLVTITKNTEEKKFELHKLFNDKVETQAELDSLKEIVFSLPFYEDLLYHDSTYVYVMGITINSKLLRSRYREEIVKNIEIQSKIFSDKYNIDIHLSGLPYTRAVLAEIIRKELTLFIILAMLVTAIILYLFFRSFKVVFFSMLVVAIAVIWSFGSMVLFGYQITIISGMIPPLMIVIGIPNSIYFLNKYQQEIKTHANKIKALQRVIRKIGNATFFTNLTTALGFATFITTNSNILVEFGIIASLNIIGIFIISLLLIPIIFSFLIIPNVKQTSHLDNKIIWKFVDKLITIVTYHRKLTFYVIGFLILAGFFGMSLIKSTGYIVDDISHSHKVYIDLKFFEKNFKGIMPLEIMIDTKKPKGVMKMSTLKKIDKLQDKLRTYPELSESMSIVNGVKFARQAYYNGKEKYYDLPSRREIGFILPYLSKDKSNIIDNFVDSTGRYARVSVKVADIGTVKMKKLYHELADDLNSIFNSSKYKATITGVSINFFKGTGYLINSLFTSLILAIILIVFFMALLFSSWRMILVSLIPNIIPLIFTSAIMGYFGIPIKPSTVLVFSIAFGISVDNTIHFLSKYRQELVITNWNISKSVIIAIKETGVSMIYSSIVLFFGFSIFTVSSFGGTVALGMLVSFTLLVAMISNLVLLPSLLLSLEKLITTKSFKEPLLSVLDEEEDIEIDELEIKR